MPPQIASIRTFVITISAFVWFFASVCHHMSSQTVFSVSRVITLITFLNFQLCFWVGPEMWFETLDLLEWQITLWANERLLTIMNQHVTFKIERPFARVWALIAILCLRCVLHFLYWNILLQSLLQIISCVFQHFICDLRNSLVGQRMLNNCAKEFIKIKIYCMCESESDLNVPPTCDAGMWKCRCTHIVEVNYLINYLETYLEPNLKTSLGQPWDNCCANMSQL